MSKVSAIVISPFKDRYADGFDFHPVVLDPQDHCAIASELGVPVSSLRWLRHGPTVYIGAPEGAVFTDTFCEAHPIVLRGKTIIFRVDRAGTFLDVSIADIEKLRASGNYHHGEPEDGRGNELRPITKPLVDIEAHLAEFLRDLFAPSPQAQGILEIATSLPMKLGKTFPMPAQVLAEVFGSYLDALNDRELTGHMSTEHRKLYADQAAALIDKIQELVAAMPEGLFEKLTGQEF